MGTQELDAGCWTDTSSRPAYFLVFSILVLVAFKIVTILWNRWYYFHCYLLNYQIVKLLNWGSKGNSYASHQIPF